jgi:SAM-dependent methyltransferase
LIRRLLRKQTLASFDYQWKELTDGGALLTEDWFAQNVERILSEELLCLRREWFDGKRILDAGCGNGRWTIGFLRLGCDVLAVDASTHGLSRLEEAVDDMVPEGREHLETREIDLLQIPPDLSTERFDLVFSFGVLHHTGDTWGALRNIARLVADDGLLFLYLYGRDSMTAAGRAKLELRRLALAPLPFELKRRLLASRPGTDVHQVFDALSPTINARHSFSEVRSHLLDASFSSIEQTIDHSELFIRAIRDPAQVRQYELARPRPPYWFDRYERRDEDRGLNCKNG